MANEDYQPQRAALLQQGAAVLKQLDALGLAGPEDAEPGAEDAIEQAIRARRALARPAPEAGPAAPALQRPAKPAANGHALFCPQCGRKVEAGDRFCAGCGARLPTAEATL